MGEKNYKSRNMLGGPELDYDRRATAMSPKNHSVSKVRLSWLLIGFVVCVCTGCVERWSYFRGSIDDASNIKCAGDSLGLLNCKLAGQVRLSIYSPFRPTLDPVGLGFLIPAGHVVKLTSATATFYLADSSESWSSDIVSSEGFHFRNTNSSEKIEDLPYADPTRELVGSTLIGSRWYSYNEYGLYGFDIHSDKPFPSSFQLQLPNVIVDGKEIAIPRIFFKYGRHTTIKRIA